MNAQLRREGALPRRGARNSSTESPEDGGEDVFDRWLRQELGRLYDRALSEPVPEHILRLLRDTEG